MTLTPSSASPTTVAYGILPNSPGAPNLATRQTTNKVQKLLERIAMGSFSLAMPSTLLVSFAGGTSAGLTGSAALTTLCLSVIKALGFATITALGTVGTFGLMCTIPVVVLGLTLLVRHLYHRKQAFEDHRNAFFGITGEASPNVLSISQDSYSEEEIDIREVSLNARSISQDSSEEEIDSEETISDEIQWMNHSRAISTIVSSWLNLLPTPTYKNYLNQFKKDLKEPVLTTAYIYIKKLIETKKIQLTELNAFLYLSVCLALAAKHHDDDCYGNSYFATMCGVDLIVFNTIERGVLKHFNYNVFITPEEFENATNLLNSISQQPQTPSPTTLPAEEPSSTSSPTA